jgi:hypothetical protein
MLRKPCAINSSAASRVSSTVAAAACEYTSTAARLRPPSSSYTGTPARFPAMSHSAWSKPDSALFRTGPFRQYEE